MAFCFEHSGCSTQISELIKELLLDTQCSVETRVARLYLLSDILSNSQQPGVKNAFRYRDAIEKMAPEVFAGLGESDPTLGRMKRHKIDTAVRSILAAWTNWSVFDATFLDELEARFEGKEIVRQEPVQVQIDNTELESQESEKEEETIILSARGDWTEVTEEGDEAKTPIQMEGTNDREEDDPAKLQDSDLDNLDGEPLDENELDDEGLRRLHFIHHVSDDECDTQIKSADSATSIDEVDGEPLEEGDFAAQ
jgi:U2-associated protein SR140